MTDLKETLDLLFCLMIGLGGAALSLLLTVIPWAIGIAEMVRWMLG